MKGLVILALASMFEYNTPKEPPEHIYKHEQNGLTAYVTDFTPSRFEIKIPDSNFMYIAESDRGCFYADIQPTTQLKDNGFEQTEIMIGDMNCDGVLDRGWISVYTVKENERNTIDRFYNGKGKFITQTRNIVEDPNLEEKILKKAESFKKTIESAGLKDLLKIWAEETK